MPGSLWLAAAAAAATAAMVTASPAPGPAPQPRFLNSPAATKYAAIGIIGGGGGGMKLPAGLAVAIGEGDAGSGSPLLAQDKLWEPRCDNGYPNIVHSPGHPGGAYQLWYGCFSSGTKFSSSQGAARTSSWNYANSSDGLVWTKPHLGVYDLATGAEAKNKALPAATIAAFKKIGTDNNIVLPGRDGLGITLDSHETNASHRYKVFGGGGVGSSPDGIHSFAFTDISFSKPPVCVPPACPAGKQRYDDHQQPLWDGPTSEYVMTTRTYPGTRAVGLFRTPTWPPTGDEQITQVEVGTAAHQLYSQITFRFYDIWLGLVMVFDAEHASTVGTVHTKLSWSADGQKGWAWVDKGGLLGKPFIPLGPAGSFSSHIIFAADAPVPVPAEESVRVYYMGGNGPHNGPRNTSLGLMRLRMDGFAGVRGSGSFTTRSLLCTGPVLRITADMVGGGGGGGSVSVGVVGTGGDGLRLSDATALTANVTDGAVVFTGAKTFAGLVGKNVTLQVEMKRAVLYTVSFFGK
jgi:hypothetical protein